MARSSGWLDDVVSAAVNGSTPLIIAVCDNPVMAQDLVSWLESAVPMVEPYRTVVITAEGLDEHLRGAEPTPITKVYLVNDATQGTTDEIQNRWVSWNTHRDLLRTVLGSTAPSSRAVFICTTLRMPEVAICAPDLLSVAEIITVTEEPFLDDFADPAHTKALRDAKRELEQRHRMSTEQFVDALLRGESPNLSAADCRRWEAIAEALREKSPSNGT